MTLFQAFALVFLGALPIWVAAIALFAPKANGAGPPLRPDSTE